MILHMIAQNTEKLKLGFKAGHAKILRKVRSVYQ